MDLPLSSGFDSVLIVVNHGLMKGVIFIPCLKAIDADLHQIGWMQDHVHFLCVARHLTQYLRFHLIPTVRMLSKLKDI